MTAIYTENLGKQYRIGGRRQGYRTLRDTLTDGFLSPFRRAGRLLHGQYTGAAELDEVVWALSNVSFDVDYGEVVGIIGRNGAGKSTLLKILSRITEPTRGRVRLRGRVGSLLEVGTGFHPELTGSENIYLNGAILGMRRSEINRKFDEIVAFAEVDRFIDTPVKHYSSGMHMRLAFAVAAHLEPEILLVDEVLAVGDAEFQRKCLNKMEHVGKEGRTVLFVSHNMPAVTRLCERTILLHEGSILEDGPSQRVVAKYLNSGLGTMAAREWQDLARAPGNEIVRLRAVRIRGNDGKTTEAIDIRMPAGIEVEFEVLKSGSEVSPWFTIRNEEGSAVFSAIDQDAAWRGRPRPAGRYVSTAWIPGNLLSEGTMIVKVAMVTQHPRMIHFNEPDSVAFQVIESLNGDSARGNWTGPMPGCVRPKLHWTTQLQKEPHDGALSATEKFTAVKPETPEKLSA